MSSSPDFVEFVVQQIQEIGQVRFRKMFGEYMIYVQDRPLLLVCDNTVYIKINPLSTSLLSQAKKGSPYPGAKDHYIISEVEDKEYLLHLVQSLLE